MSAIQQVVPVSRLRGRPCTYDEATASVILERLAEGESLLAICRDPTLPPESTVRLWVLDDREGFAARYAIARNMGLDHIADDVLEIADEEGDSSRNRLRFDARRWYLSKLAPKRYGERVDVTSGDAPLQALSPEAAEARLVEIMKRAQQRAGGEEEQS